ncbi:hypothetical protein [Streptomyces hesseae]|uniref:Conjugal transfer protein TraB n=1 Tax=Streptomyces hesseae TaxID=3075519 RepID=A0ABU2SNH9_9ACTN|nr:hypothetical protein [Streptomyces sp. DSM 40473]MDT0450537.1 hypothetical protein [Streptomyces sp. DSM 40473]
MGAGDGAMRAGLESLESFKGRVDELLTYLQGSAAAPHHMADNHLVPAQLGVGFAEVDSLYSAYNEVHAQLKALSQLLSDQIEALGTAVHAAKIGYANVDADLRDRMWAIQARTRELYVPSHDPNPNPAPGATPAPAPAPAPRPQGGSDEGRI